jgi:HemY protein
MRRVVVTLLVAAAAVGIAWAASLIGGTLSLRLGAIDIETTTPIALAALVVVFALLYAIVRLLGIMLRAPRHWRYWLGRRNRALGDAAVTQALVALAANDGPAARRQAARARRLLGDTAQTLVVAAEAARLAGREAEAEVLFRSLSARRDAGFLGLRGLFRLALARDDVAGAQDFARQAEAARPGATWLQEDRTRLALRARDWASALKLADSGRSQAALATAAANASADAGAALRLAHQAWKADPTLAPAALAYAGRLRAAGKERRAQAVVRQSWTLAPHRDLAEFALARSDGALRRLQAAQQLAAANPNHVESQLLLARASLDAGLSGEAHRHAAAARAAGADPRRTWLLLAELEGDGEARQNALRQALVVEPEAKWTCTSCHTSQAAWQPVCPACGTVGGLR